MLTTLMCLAWLGVFFSRNLQPGLQYGPPCMAGYSRPAKRESEITVRTPLPADFPESKEKLTRPHSGPPFPGTLEMVSSWPAAKLRVGAKSGEASRAGPAVMGVKEDRVCARQSVQRPAPLQRGFRGRNDQPSC